MAESSVLCFPLSGQEDGSFLLEVSSSGTRPLDLQLLGSEGSAVFMIKLRHKKIDEHKAATGHCTDEEWAQILTTTLVDKRPVPDIEVRAEAQSDGSLVSLSFRKNIQGITQRLGSIKLSAVEDVEISTFDWCISTIAARNKAQEELVAANAKAQALEDDVKELKAQLEEFIKAKDENEAELLEKFRDLLNEKKVKIRQQQRLLATAKVDETKLAEVDGTQSRTAGKSRASKRKADIKEESESDGDFERMDVDSGAGAGNAPEAEAETESDVQQQGTTDDDTPSEADSDAEPAPPSVRSQPMEATRPARGARGASQKKATSPEKSAEPEQAPPPKRTLPFTRGKKTAPPPPPKDNADDAETESDDEL
ncbi:hypothetical protein F4780DRAFT_373533 [Xylariomycetidae sp. FL0641]|nr:hypothetical protein F4780DRAFT_373533 [Xylariomycetidae sp. FL0641]